MAGAAGEGNLSGQDQLRLFYAVLIPPALRETVAEVQERLGRAGGRVKWVRPESLHLTLKFLGETPAEKVAELARIGRQVAQASASFEVELAGVGAFPNVRRPRVLWVGVREGAEELTVLAERLRSALMVQTPGLGDDRPFAAHCTIGRVRREQRPGALAVALGEEAGWPGGRLRVAVFHLMRSELSPRGPTYTSLAAFALRPGATEA